MNATSSFEAIDIRTQLPNVIEGAFDFVINIPQGAALLSVQAAPKLDFEHEISVVYIAKRPPVGQEYEVCTVAFKVVPLSPRPVFVELGEGGLPFPVGTIMLRDGKSYLVIRVS